MRNHHRLLITVLTLLALATAWRLAHGAEPAAAPERRGPAPPPDAAQAKLPRPIVQVPPTYPRAAREAGIQGTVWVRVGIDRTGRVTSAKVTRSIAGLDEAALASVRRWTFATRLPNGKPSPRSFEVPVRFTLHGPDGPPRGMGPPDGGPPHGGPPPPPGNGPRRDGPPRVSRSVAGLDEAALAAVRQWRFKPARSGGHPVDTWLAVPVRF